MLATDLSTQLWEGQSPFTTLYHRLMNYVELVHVVFVLFIVHVVFPFFLHQLLLLLVCEVIMIFFLVVHRRLIPKHISYHTVRIFLRICSFFFRLSSLIYEDLTVQNFFEFVIHLFLVYFFLESSMIFLFKSFLHGLVNKFLFNFPLLFLFLSVQPLVVLVHFLILLVAFGLSFFLKLTKLILDVGFILFDAFFPFQVPFFSLHLELLVQSVQDFPPDFFFPFFSLQFGMISNVKTAVELLLDPGVLVAQDVVVVLLQFLEGFELLHFLLLFLGLQFLIFPHNLFVVLVIKIPFLFLGVAFVGELIIELLFEVLLFLDAGDSFKLFLSFEFKNFEVIDHGPLFLVGREFLGAEVPTGGLQGRTHDDKFIILNKDDNKMQFLLFRLEGLETFPEIEYPSKGMTTYWSSSQSAKIIYQKPSPI